jgi:hypothetical protein
MKKPRFFCEHCGAEVSRDVKACPRCGRFFASVRCPACGFSGEEKLFSGGCPVCGYSSSGSPGPLVSDIPPRAAGRLPVWVYILTVFILLFVFALLFILVTG